MAPRIFKMPPGKFGIAGSGRPRPRKRRGKDGKVYLSKSYYVTIETATGMIRPHNLCTGDLAAASDIISLMRKTAHRRLLEIDDPFEHSRQISITRHVADYGAWLESQDYKPNHIANALSRITRLLKEAKVTRWQRLDADIIAKAIGRLTDNRSGAGSRPPKLLSLQTRRHYIASTKAFFSWMVDVADRMPRHPLRGLKLPSVRRADRIRIRRYTPVEQFRDLTTAAYYGPPLMGMSGPHRSLLWETLGGTGLRDNEARRLTRKCFELDGPAPCIVLDPTTTKNREGGTVDLLQPELVEALRIWLAEHPDEERPFPVPYKPNEMLRVDLAAAGLPYCDDHGEYLDVHSLRHTAISNYYLWSRDLPMTRRYARHGAGHTTDAVYLHLTYRFPNIRFERMPDLSPRRRDDTVVEATGTVDEIPLKKEWTPEWTQTHAIGGRHGTACGTEGAELQPCGADIAASGPISGVEIKSVRPLRGLSVHRVRCQPQKDAALRKVCEGCRQTRSGHILEAAVRQ